MSYKKILLIFSVLLDVATCKLWSDSKIHNEKSSLYYLLLGCFASRGCDDSTIPAIGLGDGPIKCASIATIKYVSLKGFFLFYAYPETKNQLYLGAGPEACGVWGLKDKMTVTAETVSDYEFRLFSHLKTFNQSETTLPIVYIDGSTGRECIFPESQSLLLSDFK